MKNLLLSISFLLVMPSLFSYSMSSDRAKTVEVTIKEMNTVCVPYKASNPGFQNDAYFYTRECAQRFSDANPGTTLTKGNFCVNENIVFVCIE